MSLFGNFGVQTIKWLKSIFKPRHLLNIKIIEGPGEPIVFLHGLASNIEFWNNVVEPLRGRHKMVLVDLLGFGASPRPTDSEYTVDDHVDAIVHTLKKAHIWQRSIIVSHSMGGIIAARFAVRFPDKVKNMLLCSIPIYKRSELNDKKLLQWQSTSDELYFKAYRKLRANPDWAIKGSDMLKKLNIKGMDVTTESWPAFHESLHNTIEKQRTSTDLAGLHIPIKIIYGRFDVLVVSRNITALSKNHANITVRKINAGHELTPGFSKIIVGEIEKII